MKCSYILIHHSATEPDASVADIRAAHRARGFIDIGYHYLIHPDGTVAPGRPEHQQGAHARGLNARSLGICCIGNFETTQPDPRQIQALTELVILLTRRYAVAPHRIIGHRDVMRISPAATVTVCPGTHLACHIPQIRSKALSCLLADNGYENSLVLDIPEDQQALTRSRSSTTTGDQATLLYLVRSLSNLEHRDSEGIHPLDLFEILRSCNVNVTVLVEQLEDPSHDQAIVAHLESLGVTHRALATNGALKALSGDTLCLIQGYELALHTINRIRELLPPARIAIHASTLRWLTWREVCIVGTSHATDSKAAAQRALELSAYILADEVWVSSSYEQVSLHAELPQVKTRTIGRLCHLSNSAEHLLGDRILCLANFTLQNRGEDAGWLEDLLTALRVRSPHTLPLDIAGDDPPESIRRLAKAAGVSLTPRYVPGQPLPRLVLAPLWPGIPHVLSLRSLIEQGIPLMTNTHGNARLGLRHGRELLVADTTDEALELLTQVQSGVHDLDEMRRCALRQLSLQCSQQTISQLLLASLIAPRAVIAVHSRGDGRYLEQCLGSLCTNTRNPYPPIVIFNQAARIPDLQPLQVTGAEISFAGTISDTTPLGICRAVTERYPRHDIVLIHDDLVVQHSGWLNSLANCAYSAAQVVASCGMIINTKREIVEAGAEMNLAGYSHTLAQSKPVYFPEALSHRVVGFGSSSLLYLRRDALDLFAHFEPSSSVPLHQIAELQYRAHAHGWSTRYTPLCVATTLAAEFSIVETPKETLDAGGFRLLTADTSFEEYNG